MPSVQTRDFGEVKYDPAAELAFPSGIPGFHGERRFVLIEPPPLFSPMLLLQSLDTASFCFLAVPVSVLDPAYQSGIGPEDLRILGLDESRQPEAGEEALYLAILSSSDGSFTANLLAPVVVNRRTRTAVQAVRHDRLYSHRHPLPPGLLEHLCS
jgi:flagellar assembly factor FliW